MGDPEFLVRSPEDKEGNQGITAWRKDSGPRLVWNRNQPSFAQAPSKKDMLLVVIGRFNLLLGLLVFCGSFRVTLVAQELKGFEGTKAHLPRDQEIEG